MMRVLLAVAAFLLAPAGALAADQGTQLERASALWSAQHLHNYSFRITASCFCFPASRRPTVVTVRNGKPHGYGKYFKGELQTIPEMFATIRKTLTDPAAGPSTVTYDELRGFPRSVRLDPIKLAIDDELSWTVDRFRPLK